MRLEVFDHLDMTEVRLRGTRGQEFTALIHDGVDDEQPRRRGRPRKCERLDAWE